MFIKVSFTQVVLISVFTIVTISLIWRKLSNRFTLPCPSWLSWMIELDNPFAKEHHALSIIKASSVTKGMRVLDAGCGPGRLTIPLAKTIGEDGNVVALDIQQSMLDKVREKVKKNALDNVLFLNTPLGNGHLKENAFDRIFLVTVIGEIPEKKEALTELYKALKKDGLLVITETIFDPHYQSFDKLKKIVGKYNFQLESKSGNFLAYTANFKKTTH